MVTVTQINLVGSGGVTVLSDAKVTTNLLKLSNDVSTLVQDAVVKAGTYSELDFVISGGYVEVQNATGTGTTIYASSSTYEGLPAGAVVGGTLKPSPPRRPSPRPLPSPPARRRSLTSR